MGVSRFIDKGLGVLGFRGLGFGGLGFRGLEEPEGQSTDPSKNSAEKVGARNS